MEDAVAAGQLRAIGVSSFDPGDLPNIIVHAESKPAVNRIRVPIGHIPAEVVFHGKTSDNVGIAFSPNATGILLRAS